MKRLQLILAACTLLLASAACSMRPGGNPPGGREPSATPTRQATAAVTGVTLITPTSPAVPTITAPPVSAGTGTFNLDDPSVGLSGLGSYRQTLVMGFDGTVSGQEKHSKTVLRRSVTTQPPSQVTWVSVDGGPEQMFAKANGISYQQTGADGPCAASTSPDAPSASFNLQTLPTVLGAEPAGEETVNGVASRHYTFDQRALGQAGSEKAQGEFWIAAQGGYMVKYTLRIQAEAGRLGPGVAGTQFWDYQLTDANALTAPDLPKACAGVLPSPQ